MLCKYKILDNDFPIRQTEVIAEGQKEALSIGSSRLKTCNIRIVNILPFNPAN